MLREIIDRLYYTYEIIFTKILFFTKLYIRYHKPSVRKEIELAGINKSDKVIHVGCGAIPYTPIIIFQDIGCSITGIDYDNRSVNNAKSLLRKMGLGDNINISFGDGQSFDVNRYDVIFLSHGIKSTLSVLSNILNSMKDNVRIVFRKPADFKSDKLDEILSKYYYEKKKMLLNQDSIIIYNNK